MSYLTAGAIAIALYLVAVLYQILQLRNERLQPIYLQGIAAAALIFHGILAFRLIVREQGFDLGFFNIGIGIFFTINLILLLSSLKKPLTPLFLPWFLLTAIGLGISIALDRPTASEHIPLNIGLHIIASILAYSLLTIASLQALALALQNWLLRHKHLGGWLTTLPPLQIMESLLFELIWAGFAFLSLSLISGALFYEDIQAQHLAHKIFFSCLGWLFYATLLWGHHKRGWRGNTAVRWTLGGFAALVVAFWGTKLVLQFILGY